MAGKTVQEPMAGVVIAGVLHQVPASEVELQQEIDRGVKLKQEIKALEEILNGRGKELVALISAYEEEVRKAQAELAQERGPVQAQIAAKTKELRGVQDKLFELMVPRMGDQKSMKFPGLAGSIVAQRERKMSVPDHAIPAVRKLLGPVFGEMFEVSEKAKPRTQVWTVLRNVAAKKAEQLRQLITIEDEGGSVRFVD